MFRGRNCYRIIHRSSIVARSDRSVWCLSSESMLCKTDSILAPLHSIGSAWYRRKCQLSGHVESGGSVPIVGHSIKGHGFERGNIGSLHGGNVISSGLSMVKGRGNVERVYGRHDDCSELLATSRLKEQSLRSASLRSDQTDLDSVFLMNVCEFYFHQVAQFISHRGSLWHSSVIRLLDKLPVKSKWFVNNLRSQRMRCTSVGVNY